MIVNKPQFDTNRLAEGKAVMIQLNTGRKKMDDHGKFDIQREVSFGIIKVSSPFRLVILTVDTTQWYIKDVTIDIQTIINKECSISLLEPIDTIGE